MNWFRGKFRVGERVYRHWAGWASFRPRAFGFGGRKADTKMRWRNIETSPDEQKPLGKGG